MGATVSTRAAMTRRPVLAYACAAMTDAPATPSLAVMQRARARQDATRRLLRPLGAAVVVAVFIAAANTQPTPGTQGRGLGVLLALVGFVAGMVGGVLSRGRLPVALTTAFFVVLVASSAALVWLQPNGPGYLGCFVAVSAAVMRLPGRAGVAIGVMSLVGLGLALGLTHDRSVTGALLTDLGVIAFFIMARLANRLREGQEQAIGLLAELEESHRAQAETAALAERQRLAREMHDVLAHSLSGLVLQLEGARLLARTRDVDAELCAAVERALHLGKAGLEEARRAIAMLRDDELPGPERLPALVLDFERDAGVPCRIEVSGEQRSLGSVARLTVYRVAQEALTNVRKHAAPKSVAVRLDYEPAGTRLVVEDFGAPAAARVAAGNGVNPQGGGYGITGMRERAELLGGRLVAGATEGGFRVELWVPA